MKKIDIDKMIATLSFEKDSDCLESLITLNERKGFKQAIENFAETTDKCHLKSHSKEHIMAALNLAWLVYNLTKRVEKNQFE